MLSGDRMKKSLFLWQFAGFSLGTLAGTLLHFVYEWTNESLLVAPFSGVNESTWEHMKLLFFPLFVFALLQSCFFKEYPCFWRVKAFGITVGLCAIPVLFYTYNGVFGKSPDWINITIYFLAAAIAFFIEWYLFSQKKKYCKGKNLALLYLCIIGLLFIVFTFAPPHLPLFEDPVTKTYSIPK